MKAFSKHKDLKTSYTKTDQGIIKFIPPVELKKRKYFKKIPKLGEHSKKIKKDFNKV